MEPTENQGAYQPRTPSMAQNDPVVQWLLRGDPAIRWQCFATWLTPGAHTVA
jgi:hypothetical protein